MKKKTAEQLAEETFKYKEQPKSRGDESLNAILVDGSRRDFIRGFEAFHGNIDWNELKTVFATKFTKINNRGVVVLDKDASVLEIIEFFKNNLR